MGPIAIAMGLAQFAPSLLRLFGVGEKSVSVAEKVIGIAQTVTGTQSPEEALAAMKASAEHQAAFNMEVLKQNEELEKAYMADVQSARQRDAEFVKAGTRNYRADIMFLLAVGVIMWLVYIIWKNPELNEYVKGVFTFILGRFTGYLDSIYNFEFGTTRSSKQKDSTITNLSNKG